MQVGEGLLVMVVMSSCSGWTSCKGIGADVGAATTST
jgi:hypothetical protein